MVADLISVIVPIYNGEKYVSACVDSIQKQTYRNIEILLIDDGSTDNSYSLCSDLANRDNRIRVIQTENHGQGTARNLGIDVARGEYISFCDIDDRMAPNMLETLHKMIVDNESDFAACDYSSMKEGSVTFKRGDGDACVHAADREEALRVFSTGKGIAWTVWDKLYRASKCKQVRFSTERIHAEDSMFVLHFIKMNERFCWAKLGLYWYYDTNQESYTKKEWSKSNIGITMFYKELFETIREYNLEELSDRIAVRYYENLLSTYIRCEKRKYENEVVALHQEMAKNKDQMLKSGMPFLLKADFLLCLWFPRVGIMINHAYK